ncbi:hypothetical protein WJ08_04105 [Burkholderia vietnamiensis]|nr:hypothetical protein WJ08_04105 [Burkholderia vietnamiensis]KVF42656.1 hypothetical protein WJ10_01050 [Burkholderia vietnamiensis]
MSYLTASFDNVDRPVESELTPVDSELAVVDVEVDSDATLLFVVERPVARELIPVDTDVDMLPIAWFVA